MRLVAATNARGWSLTVADIFNSPQLSKLARVLEEPEGASGKAAVIKPFSLLNKVENFDDVLREAASQCSLEAEQIVDLYPCTPLQEGLMSLSVRQVGAYVSQMAFRMPPELPLDRFKEAWDKVIRAHPILRTRIVHSATLGSLQVVLREGVTWQTGTSLEAYAEADRKIPITHGGPLIRLCITGIEDRHFVWTAHHAVYDGYSLGLLFNQVQEMFKHGIAPEGPSFNSFISYLAGFTADSAASDQFWNTQFQGGRLATFPPLPSHSYEPRPRAREQIIVSTVTRPHFPVLSSTLLRAAWALVLARYADSEDIVFGVTLSGRNAAANGIERMLGPTITTVPLHVHLNPNQQISAFLQSIQGQAVEMMPFEHTGLQKIRQLGGNAKDAVDFKSLFVIQPASESANHSKFLGLEPVPATLGDFDTYALNLECRLEASGVVVEARFDAHVIPAIQMRNMLYQYEHVIKQLSTMPDSLPIKDVTLFGPRDLEQVENWNKYIPQAINSCVPDLFTGAGYPSAQRSGCRCHGTGASVTPS